MLKYRDPRRTPVPRASVDYRHVDRRFLLSAANLFLATQRRPHRWFNAPVLPHLHEWFFEALNGFVSVGSSGRQYCSVREFANCRNVGQWRMPRYRIFDSGLLDRVYDQRNIGLIGMKVDPSLKRPDPGLDLPCFRRKFS